MILKENEHILSKRLNKVLETVFQDDQGTLEALKQLSTFYPENTIQARRDLRSKIEKRSLDINVNLLSSFSIVKDSFTSIYNQIAEMSNCVKEITCKLQNSKQQTRLLLQETSALQSGRNKMIIQQKISSSFLNKFQLSSDDLLILYGNKKSLSLTHATFSALDKIQEIHNNSRILMRSGLQTMALDTMEQMILHQEEALEKVYRWTQSHCRYVDNPELTELIANSMLRMQDRLPLFRYVIDEYCICRRSILVSEFINALNKGGPSGKPAPIEMKAHDIQIYVTDMFVWLNKAISVEQENLLLLTKLCKNIGNSFIQDALIRICDGICHPLKIRIEKVLNVPTPATVLHSVVNLLRYYKKCICKIVSKGSLEKTLLDLQNLCEQVFFTTLQQEVNNALIKVETPLRDLSPTPVVNNLLALLRDLLSTANMSEGRENDMKKGRLSFERI
ncbi:conserved oligomeric Golgi complex subunit 6 isoform X2 [Anoplophora glabripennis]|uniref:conserved oligomeric Golgi complex subunit 6 isoform X2 n=1 Tax=Anoplophora glabripennis TaxID=217634 RepID=UPI0008740D1C|nr:conserved oligomeric Golgi complex subunit 6 isoform X2 [Anoplophora glabripennis]